MVVRGICVQYTKWKVENAEILKTKNLQAQIDHLMNLLKTQQSKENILKLIVLEPNFMQIAEYLLHIWFVLPYLE